jgi:hypothetical protein
MSHGSLAGKGKGLDLGKGTLLSPNTSLFVRPIYNMVHSIKVLNIPLENSLLPNYFLQDEEGI